MGLRESARVMASRCSAEVMCGRYRLDGLIGSGGAADVHRGFDLRLRRPVAVKVFRPGTGFDMEEASTREAVILARLHHPGLVTAYDAGQHNDRVFLVMQLIEGDTLKKRIARAPLSPAATAAVGAGVAHALAHAHEAGVVHRDVKPSNILLDAAHHTYLTDFGISRLLDATTRTATGVLIGTAAYLSPEQVVGRPVGRPADVYALGLVLLECLTGRLEYDGGPLEAAIARLHRPPVLPDGLPKEWDGLLRDMTALDERDRPTARDCARALSEFADPDQLSLAPRAPAVSLVPHHEPSRTVDGTHAKPPTVGPRTAPYATRSRRRTLVATASVTLTAVMATALAVTDDSASSGNDRSATRVTSAPTEETDPPRTTQQKEAAAPSTDTAPSPARGASAGALPADGTGRRAASPSHGPGRATGIGTATHDFGTPTSQAAPSATGQSPARNGTPDKAPNRPPGQAKKTERAGAKDPRHHAKSSAAKR
ncbi:putative serine/threonine kinase [Streptomyces ambofaciens ATCC 23877]|uniref:non-specific serine/threonine protein kinase n=1 Tax=Streptomyces ambofaciens (strain ATCC 23877 / 3486 / DSM 40053 / JCM 4204 / NBRC 12836 / NRRL B-2516) TaxID=278992 RepID=A3KHZ4_STRA7|nr:serine/threonine-protein kinase [Streptomyces ambofaciens]AKZ53434.1 putative serine/threonine kinase [Streptomyces ambofaciens ATCC 23877]CAJ89321.1 putative serine/threonine kinase [Streptomyces ambofaciens ATCC 23877]